MLNVDGYSLHSGFCYGKINQLNKKMKANGIKAPFVFVLKLE